MALVDLAASEDLAALDDLAVLMVTDTTNTHHLSNIISIAITNKTLLC